MENLASLGKKGKGSRGPHPKSSLEATNSVVPREPKGGGEVRGEVNTIQLDGVCCMNPLERPICTTSPRAEAEDS